MLHQQENEGLLARQLRAHAASVSFAKRGQWRRRVSAALTGVGVFVCGLVIGMWWAAP